jgi:hypothetical protein
MTKGVYGEIPSSDLKELYKARKKVIFQEPPKLGRQRKGAIHTLLQEHDGNLGVGSLEHTPNALRRGRCNCGSRSATLNHSGKESLENA